MSLLRVGLNPYGIAYTLGIHGRGTARANPSPTGLGDYLKLALDLGMKGVEIHHAHLNGLSDDELRQLRGRFEDQGWFVIVACPLSEAASSLEAAGVLGARILRMHLTHILCGDRGEPACKWSELVTQVRRQLRKVAAMASDLGIQLGIEDHQDFTSAELLELCEEGGTNVGITLDTANPLSVGECPLAFVRRVAERVVHVHLKDYWPQWTDEGYRLIRCPVGDGCVPFDEIVSALDQDREIPATIEIGALSARHIRLFREQWWRHYPSGHMDNLPAALLAARKCRLAEDAEWRTPWELEKAPEEIVDYEMRQLKRSVENVKSWGWV